MNQLYLLLVLLCSRNSVASIRTVSFRMAICFAVVYDVCVYYARILRSNKGWQVCVHGNMNRTVYDSAASKEGWALVMGFFSTEVPLWQRKLRPY